MPQISSRSLRGSSMTVRPATDTRTRSPSSTRPITAAGTPEAAARVNSSATLDPETDTTTREGDSPKIVATSTKLPIASMATASDLYADAEGRIEAALGERDAEAALRTVVRRLEESRRRERHEQLLQRGLALRGRASAPFRESSRASHGGTRSHPTPHGLVRAAPPRRRPGGTAAARPGPRPRSVRRHPAPAWAEFPAPSVSL